MGTKDYWDRSYGTEIKNYKSHGDVGEVWFDEDSQFRVIGWMLKNDIPEDSQLIDLGKPKYSKIFCSILSLNRFRMWQWNDVNRART